MYCAVAQHCHQCSLKFYNVYQALYLITVSTNILNLLISADSGKKTSSVPEAHIGRSEEIIFKDFPYLENTNQDMLVKGCCCFYSQWFRRSTENMLYHASGPKGGKTAAY